MEVVKRRRPWKVRWWDPLWNDYGGASYATEEKAVARGEHEYDEGCSSISVWQNDEKGYVVPGTIRMIGDNW